MTRRNAGLVVFGLAVLARAPLAHAGEWLVGVVVVLLVVAVVALFLWALVWGRS